MDIQIAATDMNTPSPRAWALTMTIRTFKGRRDVEVHLFRPAWNPAEENACDWDALVGGTLNGDETADSTSARRIILESFTAEERDQIVEYLKAHYSSRLTAIAAAPLPFPVPSGMPALSDLDEGKSIGFIRFEKIGHFDLPFAMRGLYDLSRHRPIVDG